MGQLTEDIKLLVKTRHPLVTIQTMEEEYASRLVRQAGRELSMAVLEWSISQGLCRSVPTPEGVIAGTQSLEGALRFALSNPALNIYLLKDAMQSLNGPAAGRLLREVGEAFSHDCRTVFMVDAGGRLPDSVGLMAVPFDLDLPNEYEIAAIIRRTVQDAGTYLAPKNMMSQEEFEAFVSNLRGLTRQEVAQVVADAVLGRGGLAPGDIERAVEAKRRRLRQTGVLDYIAPPESTPKVGGMKSLRRWLGLRAKAFGKEAANYGLETPRGILMLGVQGCGKSLMAKYVAAEWRMPLVRLDVGSLYDKYVGETERHLREAFATASAMAPCVLWIDEVEKAFASAAIGAGAAATDGGLSQRLFGQLLTWMQEHEEAVFIVATANDVSALPPELLRKGRFDEVFFVDLPDAEARREIIAIHLSRRKRDPQTFDLAALAEASEGFSGAELEQVIVAAMYAAFAESREVTTEDLRQEIARTRPLSVLMAEKMTALRLWADGRCVRAD